MCTMLAYRIIIFNVCAFLIVASTAADEQGGIPLPSTSVSKSHIKLFLYTKQKRNVAISDTKIDEIDTEKEIKIISHGWNEDKLAWYYPILTAALLKKGDYNVIQLDWSFYSRQVYLKAAENTRGVGYYVGTVIAKIHKERNVPLEKFHLIGHSLGSHVLGFAGKKVKELTGGKVRLITGLDPAGPEFEVPMREKNSRLSDDDAKIVEAIHTNIGLNGFVKPIGTIDFYVNGGGPAQPGCNGAPLCSHQKSVGYYIDGLQKNGLKATECESQIKFETGACKSNKNALLGDDTATSEPTGVFYLNAITLYRGP